MSQSKKRKGSSERLLYLLKTRGPQTATVLSELMQMTMMGARQLLLTLQAQNLVETYSKSSGPGRPKLYWQLSDQGHARFPDRHADLTLSLLNHVKNTLGEAGFEQVVSAREKDMLEAYQLELKGQRSLHQKVHKLAQLRTQEGYMAEVVDDSGDLLLIENHCPICVAAQTCQSFCRSELRIFELCLQARVERVEYILQGARRCVYKISPLV